MKEDLLHFIWKYQKIPTSRLYTSLGQKLSVVSPGLHNQLAGPDFFNAKIRLEGQLWAGNVEIHLCSSDWYAHGHEKDTNFNNVILHVVWEDNVAVFRKDETEIPTLELKYLVSSQLLENYRKLFQKRRAVFINCQNHIAEVDGFRRSHWLERQYFDRLEQKTTFILKLLEEFKNDWENACFVLLLKNFGSAINGNSFYSLARAVDFALVRKLQNKPLQLESLLLGLSKLLERSTEIDEYHTRLQEEYLLLRQKFGLKNASVLTPEFFGLRPANFPTIRLSQVANLYAREAQIFSKLIEAKTMGELYEFFDVGTNEYWETHFTFGKISKKRVKKVSKRFIDLLIINTIIPLKFCYARSRAEEINDEIIALLSGVKGEKNSISERFGVYGIAVKNAMESQALIQLYHKYCSKNKCLQCAIGTQILSGK